MTENFTIQYITDEAGNKQAVVVPFEEWQKMLNFLAELSRLRAFKVGLETAFKEVEEIKQGKLPQITLSEFLNKS